MKWPLTVLRHLPGRKMWIPSVWLISTHLTLPSLRILQWCTPSPGGGTSSVLLGTQGLITAQTQRCGNAWVLPLVHPVKVVKAGTRAHLLFYLWDLKGSLAPQKQCSEYCCLLLAFRRESGERVGPSFFSLFLLLFVCDKIFMHLPLNSLFFYRKVSREKNLRFSISSLLTCAPLFCLGSTLTSAKWSSPERPCHHSCFFCNNWRCGNNTSCDNACSK